MASRKRSRQSTRSTFLPDIRSPLSGSSLPADVGRNDTLNDRRLLVLVMDNGIASHPRFRESARQIGRSVLSRLGPKDLAAVVFTGDSRNAQDFTLDRARLLAAVNSFTWATGPSSGPRAIRQTIEYLSRAPERRKVVVYVAMGIDTSQLSRILGASKRPDDWQDQIAEEGELGEIFRKAQMSMVNVYPIDPSGLNGLESIRDPRRYASVHEIAVRARESLQVLASHTGGYAVTNTNEF